MTHPNDMTAWETIECQRGHEHHETREITVELGGPTPYADYTSIPERLARSFLMEIYPPEIYPVDGGAYCPAHDAVSETLVSHGVWEPRETVLALSVLADVDAPGAFVDVGSQIGWFSLLALSCARNVVAIDADQVNLAALSDSAGANGWRPWLVVEHERIGPESSSSIVSANIGEPIRLAKIDVEGAEPEAVDLLSPWLETGEVDHMLVEISPVFHDGYPDLVERIVEYGFDAYVLPPKVSPAIEIDALPDSLLGGSMMQHGEGARRALVGSWHQENVWFARQGAEW